MNMIKHCAFQISLFSSNLMQQTCLLEPFGFQDLLNNFFYFIFLPPYFVVQPIRMSILTSLAAGSRRCRWEKKAMNFLVYQKEFH